MLNVGIIGCGKIAEVRHAPEYLENPSCNIVGFFDEIPARAESYAEKFGKTPVAISSAFLTKFLRVRKAMRKNSAEKPLIRSKSC